MTDRIKEIISESAEVKKQLLEDDILIKRVEEVVDLISTAFQNGRKVFFCGNGGSAADAQHLAAEFSGRFYINRKPLPAEALHCNSSYLTAVANDYHYDIIYARMVEAFATKGDILIGLSTSGNSPNIIKAFETARSKEVTTIGFTGIGGGDLKNISDFLFNVPSKNTPRIQESHIMIGHIICELVEKKLFG